MRKKIYATPQDYLDHQRDASFLNRDVVSYDGEGLGSGRDHRYAIMVNDKGDVLVEKQCGQGIGTRQALDFLLDCKEKYPEAIHVGYGLSYDVNMILKGVGHETPYRHLKMLLRNRRMFWHNYEIKYIPRKYFYVARYEKLYGDKRRKEPEATIMMWDFLSFFQEQFVDALDGCLTEEELKDVFLDTIKDGKWRRGRFTEDDLSSGYMESYTVKECKALTVLVKKFRGDCIESGIRPVRWDGAGASAAALLTKNNVGDVIKKSNMLLSEDLVFASEVAYGGGRSEMFKYGHTDAETYHYDIIAAFPSVMPEMPDLSDGEWLHDGTDVSKIYDFALYKIYWDFRYVHDANGKRHHANKFKTMFPFFYRLPWHEPRVFYPPQGYTWVYGPELKVALKYINWLCGEMKIVDSWVFMPHGNSRPFNFVNDVYGKRLGYKRSGMKGQALAIKLALNAMPGKMAQSAGYKGFGEYGRGGEGSHGEFWGKPPFFSMLYAGYIISSVRAKVYDAMMQDPTAIIAVATDGIWSERPLELDTGEWMGQWKGEVLDGFTSIQAGVYFSKKMDGEGIYHYRGFNQGSISEEEVIRQWANKGYSIPVPTRRFISIGTALESEETYIEKWGTWDLSSRTLQIQPNQMLKRQVELGRDARPNPEAAYRLIDTTASEVMMFSENIKNWSQFYSGKDVHGVPVETYLSRKHHLPWDSKEEKTDIQKWIESQEMIAEEIIDSEA